MTGRWVEETDVVWPAVAVAHLTLGRAVASPLSATSSASRSRFDGSSPTSASASAARRKARSASAPRWALASASISTVQPPSRSGSTVTSASAAATASSTRPARSNAAAWASRAVARRSSRRRASGRTRSTSARSPNAGPFHRSSAAASTPGGLVGAGKAGRVDEAVEAFGVELAGLDVEREAAAATRKRGSEMGPQPRHVRPHRRAPHWPAGSHPTTPRRVRRS